MCAFLQKFPAITGELSLSDRLVNLVEDGVDLAVRIGELEDSSYVARPVGLVRRIVVASPKYLARHGRPRTPADLAHCSRTLRSSSSRPSTRPPEWRLTVDGAIVRAPVVPRYVEASVEKRGHASAPVRGDGPYCSGLPALCSSPERPMPGPTGTGPHVYGP
jgi:DNA-binding transcriptional LysR family regulator